MKSKKSSGRPFLNPTKSSEKLSPEAAESPSKPPAKGTRFKFISPATPELAGLSLGGWNRGRSTSFGYGKRWTPINEQGKDSPPPDSYEVRTPLTQGPSIFPPSTGRLLPKGCITPGPGAYCLPTSIGQAQKWSIAGRSQSLERKSSGPSPGSYTPKYSLVESARFTTIQFGHKLKLRKLKFGPGPAAYNLAGCFQSRVRRQVSID